MPALDFILPLANLIPPGDGAMAASPARGGSTGESFDQVITRVLSPSDTGESSRPTRSNAASTGPGEGRQNPVSTPPQRRRAQTRNATSEKMAPSAGETGELPVQTPGIKSRAQISESDAGTGRGDVVASSPVRDETQVVSGSLLDFIVQLVTPSPGGVFPLAAKEKNISAAEAMPANPSVPMPSAAAGTDSVRALVTRPETKTYSPSPGIPLNSEVPLDKTGAKLISSLKPGEPQNNTARSDDLPAGKTNPGDSQLALSLLNDPKALELSATAVKATDLAAGKTNPGDSQPALSLLNDPKALELSATAVKATDLAAGKTNPSSSQPAPLPTNAPAIPDFSAADLLAAEPASEPAVSTQQNAAFPSTDLSPESTMPAQPESRGISVAKLYLPMKKTEIMDKVAGSNGKTEKVLPVGADPTVLENNLPITDALAHISPRNGSATIIIGPSTKVPDMQVTSPAEGVAASAVSDIRARTLERTHDMLASQATRLIDSKLDSLRVVIKPGAGLQLSLEMRQHGDTIDARMVLQRGDLGHLGRHWPELQQRLEQRGIRLAPLTGAENSTTSPGANGFQQPQRQFTNLDPLSASAFAEFALASSPVQLTTSSTAIATAHRGWETWA